MLLLLLGAHQFSFRESIENARLKVGRSSPGPHTLSRGDQAGQSRAGPRNMLLRSGLDFIPDIPPMMARSGPQSARPAQPSCPLYGGSRARTDWKDGYVMCYSMVCLTVFLADEDYDDYDYGVPLSASSSRWTSSSPV